MRLLLYPNVFELYYNTLLLSIKFKKLCICVKTENKIF